MLHNHYYKLAPSDRDEGHIPTKLLGFLIPYQYFTGLHTTIKSTQLFKEILATMQAANGAKQQDIEQMTTVTASQAFQSPNICNSCDLRVILFTIICIFSLKICTPSSFCIQESS